MKKRKIVLIGVVVIGSCFSIGAATGIQISAEIKSQTIYVNGDKSVNEVISYNDTTYVPLRKLGEMLGEHINYSDRNIYIGEASLISPVNNNQPFWIELEGWTTEITDNDMLELVRQDDTAACVAKKVKLDIEEQIPQEIGKKLLNDYKDIDGTINISKVLNREDKTVLYFEVNYIKNGEAFQELMSCIIDSNNTTCIYMLAKEEVDIAQLRDDMETILDQLT